MRKAGPSATRDVIGQPSALEENTTEQFDQLTKAISLRSAQGMGTDEALNEELAAGTIERNNYPSGD